MRGVVYVFNPGIFTLAAFREVEERGERVDLAMFPAADKLFLMACPQQLMREMGRLVAPRAKTEPEELCFHYGRLLGAALAQTPLHQQRQSAPACTRLFQQSGFT